jgi:hypothetical protein
MADTYAIERSAIINAPAKDIYAQIVDFRRWRSWSPWDERDPDMARTYSGADSGPGAVYSWSGNRKAGEGRMEIIGATEPSDVTIALSFVKPFKSSSTTRFLLQPTEGATKVTWTMTGPKTTMVKIMGIFKSMDKMVGPDFENGLQRLAVVTE